MNEEPFTAGDYAGIPPRPAFLAAGQLWRYGDIFAQVVEASIPEDYTNPLQQVRVMATADIGALPSIGSVGWVFVGMLAPPESVGHTVKIERPR